MRSQLDQINDWGERADAASYDAKKLAAALGVSLRQLERFFRVNAGVPPQKWLNRLRLGVALTLLDGTKSIKEVADKLGYKQASHFSRQFKAQNGMPPSEVRRSGFRSEVAPRY